MVGTKIQGCVSLYRCFDLLQCDKLSGLPLYESMVKGSVRKVARYFDEARAHNPIKHVSRGSLAV